MGARCSIPVPACLITFGGGRKPRLWSPGPCWTGLRSSHGSPRSLAVLGPRLFLSRWPSPTETDPFRQALRACPSLRVPPPCPVLQAGSSLELVPYFESRSLFALYYSATGMIVREGS